MNFDRNYTLSFKNTLEYTFPLLIFDMNITPKTPLNLPPLSTSYSTTSDSEIDAGSPQKSQLTQHCQPSLYQKILSTIEKTTKADKYVRLVCNVLKIIRAQSGQLKQKYSKLYKQLLIVRQVIRWNGLYETISEWNQKRETLFQKQNLSDFFFSLFSLFGDILDRMIFFFELFADQKWESLSNSLDQLQSDCYFIQCLIWVIKNSLGLWKMRNEEWSKQKKVKAAKVIKYGIDCITSHNKFRARVFEISQQNAGILGVISSLLGLYTILV